jgi:diguanylate cyclase (GGDEF)-like protein
VWRIPDVKGRKSRMNSNEGTDSRAALPWTTALFFAGSLVMVTLIGLLDYVTGTELRVYPLYMLPIAAVAWRVGLRYGFILSVGAVVAWSESNHLAGMSFSNGIWVVNATAHMAAFSTVVVLISYLQRSRVTEHHLARTDALTELLNARAFYETATFEIERQKRYRHPLTIAFIDLDNFKEVNDRFGHKAGDSALLAVAQSLRNATRVTDTLSRVGGDEFALLLPETDIDGARQILQRVLSAIAKVMGENGWPVTGSIGAVTCNETPQNIDALVGMADNLMYRVKHSGKNAVCIEKTQANVNPSSREGAASAGAER